MIDSIIDITVAIIIVCCVVMMFFRDKTVSAYFGRAASAGRRIFHASAAYVR